MNFYWQMQCNQIIQQQQFVHDMMYKCKGKETWCFAFYFFNWRTWWTFIDKCNAIKSFNNNNLFMTWCINVRGNKHDVLLFISLFVGEILWWQIEPCVWSNAKSTCEVFFLSLCHKFKTFFSTTWMLKGKLMIFKYCISWWYDELDLQ
jgi:hypothetical protein